MINDKKNNKNLVASTYSSLPCLGSSTIFCFFFVFDLENPGLFTDYNVKITQQQDRYGRGDRAPYNKNQIYYKLLGQWSREAEKKTNVHAGPYSKFNFVYALPV